MNSKEFILSKDVEIFTSINCLWSTKYVTSEAIAKRKNLVQIFNNTEFVATPFGSLIAAANVQSDFDLLVYGYAKRDSIEQRFSGLGHVQYDCVVIDRFDFPGKIRNAYELRPQAMYKIAAYPNILFTPDSILGGNLVLASRIRLAVVENMEETGLADSEWNTMVDDFMRYFLTSKFLSRTGITIEEATDLISKLKNNFPTFLEYAEFLERNSGKIASS